MRMRRRGPSLLGVAAVAGTAAYVGNKSAQKGAQQQANEQAQNQQLADLEQQNAALAAQQQMLLQQQQAAAAPAPVAAAPAAPSGGIDMEKLKQLADLHTAGILSDEEFAAAKAKVLADA